MGSITLTGRGRRRVLTGHPWIYADDIAAGEGQPGELLPVHDPGARPLGWGLFSSASKIAVRLVTRSKKTHRTTIGTVVRISIGDNILTRQVESAT